MIGSGTDGLATHHRAPLGEMRYGGGGTLGGGNTTGGSNTVGLGTVPPVGDGGLVVGPGGPGRMMGGFCISGEPGALPAVGDGTILGGLVVDPGVPGTIIGGFCRSGEPGDGIVLGGLVVDPGGPGIMIGGFCNGWGEPGTLLGGPGIIIGGF